MDFQVCCVPLAHVANSDYVAANFSSTFDGSTVISRRPEEEDEDAYETAVGGYWTVLVNWGRRDPNTFSTGEVPQGSVLCLKADTLENDSEGAGARPVVDALLALGTGILTAGLLMR